MEKNYCLQRHKISEGIIRLTHLESFVSVKKVKSFLFFEYGLQVSDKEVKLLLKKTPKPIPVTECFKVQKDIKVKQKKGAGKRKKSTKVKKSDAKVKVKTAMKSRGKVKKKKGVKSDATRKLKSEEKGHKKVDSSLGNIKKRRSKVAGTSQEYKRTVMKNLESDEKGKSIQQVRANIMEKHYDLTKLSDCLADLLKKRKVVHLGRKWFATSLKYPLMLPDVKLKILKEIKGKGPAGTSFKFLQDQFPYRESPSLVGTLIELVLSGDVVNYSTGVLLASNG